MRVLSGLLLLSAGALAGDRSEYAVEFPLRATLDAPAYSVELPVGVYRELVDPALRDLEAFNAAGEPVPLAVVELPPPPPTTTATRMVTTPFFRVALRDGAARGEDLAISIERAADGSLRRLSAETQAASTTEGTVALLFDAGEDHSPIVALSLDWDAAAAPVLRLVAEASDDLQRWQRVGETLSFYQLEQDRRRFDRRRVELPGWRARYLLLRAAEADRSLPEVRAVELGYAAAQAPIEPVWQWQAVQAVKTDAGVYEFQSPGPLPVQRVMLDLASRNSTAQITVYSRADARAAWQWRAQFTAYRIGVNGQDITHDPSGVGPTRDRHWRVTASPPLDQAPALRLGYRPDRVVLLARGDAPYRLAAGSARARRDEAPLAALLEQLRRQLGADWQPTPATLGEARVIAGDKARQPGWRADQGKTLLLWGVLLAGVAIVGGMVLRLLRDARGR